jgi:cytochrome c oxidase cbb3-type subunit 4
MSTLWGHVLGVLTVVLMLVFIGIWYWAWRPRHRATFDALAELPMFEGKELAMFEQPDLPTAARRDVTRLHGR